MTWMNENLHRHAGTVLPPLLGREEAGNRPHVGPQHTHTHTIKYSKTQTQVCFFKWFLFPFLYIKESIMETKHKRQVQVKNKISLIKTNNS